MYSAVVLIIFSLFIFSSCKERKTEFIESEVYKSLFLVKDLPENDSLLKKEIIFFLVKNPQIPQDSGFIFYRYTSSTSYFLKNEEYDGFGAKVLSTHNNDKLGSFIISKCKDDSTKLVGKLFYDGLKGTGRGLREIDTLIYKCK